MRRLLLSLLLLCLLCSGLAFGQATIQINHDVLIRPVAPGLLLALFARPDLVPAISGPSRAEPGADVDLKITIYNKGKANVQGTAAGPDHPSYKVDIVMSSEADPGVPVQPAVQPVYQGLTADDYVEDMLMIGGRISNTQSIGAGAMRVYTLTTTVPKNTPPGLYYIAAVADPFDHISESSEGNNVALLRIQIGALPPGDVNPPGGVRLWVMPYGVGGTPLFRIKSSGRTDYTDGLTAQPMSNAPFGGRLGLRMGQGNALPTNAMKYYRFSYRKGGSGPWTEFNEAVNVHYVVESGGDVSFPVYNLGPKPVADKYLYEFRQHNPPSVHGATTYWPTTDWFADIYSGFLNTPSLTEGLYQIKLEVFNSAGGLVTPGPGTFRFIRPTAETAGGTINTAVMTALDGAGAVFNLYIDNRPCTAFIDPPEIGGVRPAGPCGFLLYQNKSEQVWLPFHANHPGDEAVFAFSIARVITGVTSVAGDVKMSPPAPYTNDGHGNLLGKWSVTTLLADCPTRAAYSANLNVWAKATTGWSQHINSLDAYAVRAFALDSE